MSTIDETFMRVAINEAAKARGRDEVPVGAALVAESGEILATGHNRTITDSDPSGHAEIIALRGACLKIKNHRLLKTTLYVTMEPCIMCMGALVHSRIARLVFGAYDPKWGAAGSLYNFADDDRLNHAIKIKAGVCRKNCESLIKNFFCEKRVVKGAANAKYRDSRNPVGR